MVHYIIYYVTINRSCSDCKMIDGIFILHLLDVCTQAQYDDIGKKLMFGTKCGSFCECKFVNHGKYRWVQQECPSTTPVCRGYYGSNVFCDRADNYQCTDGT